MKKLSFIGVACIAIGLVVCFFNFVVGLLFAGLGACLVWAAYSYAKSVVQKQKDDEAFRAIRSDLETDETDESEDDDL